jgi:predicted Fe-Mo cluster-binding NifX family protein
MKVCVSSQGKTLDAPVDPRFGRSQYFLFVDTDNQEFESLENPNLESTSGAGIQSGQLMAKRKVQAVITGKVGPNTLQTLEAAGIEIFTGAEGTVKEAIEAYKKDKLDLPNNPSTLLKTDKTANTKRKEGFDMTLGKEEIIERKRGVGRGRGRGMGMGRGRGPNPNGDCVCLSCGEMVPHEIRVPCITVDCPKCGARMMRG